MGQPKFARKKYETPNHPWQGERIKSEHELRRKFGLKNKTEIWKAQSRLRSIRGQARELISRARNPDDVQAQMEAKRLIKRLYREGYVGDDAGLNEILGLDVERILNRRLQSQVYLKGMARTPQQARQFVSHGLIVIGERRVTVPSYVVRRDEEDNIQFVPDATVADPEHPVRPKAPGAEVVADVALRHGTGAQTATEKPTAGDAPVKTDAAPTVAPSQGERAENAQREAGPGKQPPASEAKTPAAPVSTPKAAAAATPAEAAQTKSEPKQSAETKAQPAETNAAPKETAETKAQPAETKAAPKETAETKAEPKPEPKAAKGETAEAKPDANAAKAETKAEPAKTKAEPKAESAETKAEPAKTKAEPKAESAETKAEPAKTKAESVVPKAEPKPEPKAGKGETAEAKPDPTATKAEPKQESKAEKAEAGAKKDVSEDAEPKKGADAKEGEA